MKTGLHPWMVRYGSDDPRWLALQAGWVFTSRQDFDHLILSISRKGGLHIETTIHQRDLANLKSPDAVTAYLEKALLLLATGVLK